MKNTLQSITQKITNPFRIGRTRPVFVFTVTLLLTLLTFLMVILLITTIRDIQIYFFFIIPVILSAWYGGKRSGFLSVFISSASISLIVLPPEFNSITSIRNSSILNLILFSFTGIVLSYIIDKSILFDKTIFYEKIIQEYNRQLFDLVNKYKKANEEIKARDEFLTVATHELKTPVTSMLLQVQLAIHNIRNVSLAKFSVANLLQMLDSTEQQSKRLSKMVNDLLNTSLITTGRMNLELEDCDLAKIVRDVSLRFAEKLKKENTQLLVSADKPVIGKFDKLRVEQAITNLISNAMKYGLRKPISLSITNSNSKARITIQDNGIGIPKDQLEKIFGRFKRAVTSNEYKGLGVGLYITDQIISAHKGKISVNSKPGRGTTFFIDMPLKNSA